MTTEPNRGGRPPLPRWRAPVVLMVEVGAVDEDEAARRIEAVTASALGTVTTRRPGRPTIDDIHLGAPARIEQATR